MDEDMEDKDHKGGAGDSPSIEKWHRIHLACKNAGAIIGKGRSNIKYSRQDFKTSVTVSDSNGPECVLVVGANLVSVCEILLDVIPMHEDMIPSFVENKHQQYRNLDFDVDICMLVHQSQAGCIIGRAGFKMKELERANWCKHQSVFSVHSTVN